MRARGVPSRSCLFISVAALSAALVLGVAPSAQAGNVAPNPSFELDCSGVPCSWTTNVSGAGTITRDTTVAHSSVASLKETADANGTPGAASDCIPTSAGTNVTRSYWYRTTSAFVTRVTFNLKFYASSNCSDLTSVGPSNLLTLSPIADGEWHQLMDSSLLEVFPGNNGALATLFFQCIPSTCPTGTVVNFDDVIMGSGPLAVTIASFTAVRSHKGVLVRWRTGTEANELGFNVYRQQGARRVRVNRRLLPALGGLQGSSYSYRDRRAPKHRALRYWLQDVAVHGTRAWHGPVRVSGA